MWVQNQSAVGAVLAAARKRCGLNQADVARRLSKPQSFVSNYEKGQRRIDLMELIRIAQALNADAKKLFGEIVRSIDAKSKRRIK